MKLTKLAALFLVLGMLLLTGCKEASSVGVIGGEDASLQSQASQKTEDAQGEGISLTDMVGRPIELDGPAEKVVVLSAADCEIVYALGAGDAVVGRGEYCNYPPEAEQATSIQSGDETNVEQILALKPQVVFMSNMAQGNDTIKLLEEMGIQVVISDAKTIEDTYVSIEMMGTILGKEKEATQIVQEMQDGFAQIVEKVEQNKEVTQGKSIYFEVSPLEWGLWTAGSGTFMDEIAQMLNLENTFADVDDWAEISQEQVLERDPDYIVTIAMDLGDQDPVEEILGRSGWQNMTAISEKRVFMADGDELARPAPRLLEAAEMLYSFVYER